MTKRTIAVIAAMTLIAPVGALATTHARSTPEAVHQSTDLSSAATTMDNSVRENKPATVSMPAADVEASVAPSIEDNLTPEVEDKVETNVDHKVTPKVEDNAINATEVEHDRRNEAEHNRANDK